MCAHPVILAPATVRGVPVVLQNTRHVDNPWFPAWLDGLRELGLTTEQLSWAAVKGAGRGDWLQLQWPEFALSPPRTCHALVGAARLVLQTAYARLRGLRVLLTVHNLRSHAGRHPRLETAFWWILTRLVTDVHALTAAARPDILSTHPALRRARWTVVPHGDVGLPRSPLSQAEARARTGLPTGHIALLFGTVRASKGFLAYAQHPPPPGWTVVIAGACPDEKTAADLRDQAAPPVGDLGQESPGKITKAGQSLVLRLRHHTDAELADLLAACDLVVLPAPPGTGVLNSTTALHALTAGRPIAVTDTATFAELSAQVGPGWVLLGHPVPAPADLTGFRPPTGAPDLSAHSPQAVREAQRRLFRLSSA